MFHSASIPYAPAFGMEANHTSLADFLDYMTDHYAAALKGVVVLPPSL